MITLISIDPSKTRTGVAVYNDHKLISTASVSSTGDNLYTKIHDFLEKSVIPILEPDTEIIIEVPFYSRNIKTYGIQQQVFGLIVGMISSVTQKFTMVSANTWYQKYGDNTDETSARKIITKNYVEETYDIYVNHDICDAIAIGDYHNGMNDR